MVQVRNFADETARQKHLAEIAAANKAWHEKHEGTEKDDAFKPSHANPHDRETMLTDYPVFYLDSSASAEVEQEFFDVTDKI